MTQKIDDRNQSETENTLDGFIQTELDHGLSPKQILTAFENYINTEVERRVEN